MEYKKSYFGFLMWLLCFCLLIIASFFLPEMGAKIMTAIVDNLMVTGIFVLSLIIYLTEKIYWYNGTSYEDALKADSKTRKAFAMAHMIRFGAFAGLFLVYSVVSVLTGIPIGVDVAVAAIGLILTALSTIRIRLNTK